MEDEFIYYDNRIEELNKLLSHAKSITLKELIRKSINLTETSLEKLLLIQKITIVYLTQITQ
jgi:hypothetical protein